MSKFDMEQAAQDALNQWDNEHGGDNEAKFDADGFAECPCGCGKKTHKDVLEERSKQKAIDVIGQTITAEIKAVPGSDKAGVIVSLPETKEQAYLLILGIINTMSMAGGETFDEILGEVSRLNSMGAMSKGKKYVADK